MWFSKVIPSTLRSRMAPFDPFLSQKWMSRTREKHHPTWGHQWSEHLIVSICLIRTYDAGTGSEGTMVGVRKRSRPEWTVQESFKGERKEDIGALYEFVLYKYPRNFSMFGRFFPVPVSLYNLKEHLPTCFFRDGCTKECVDFRKWRFVEWGLYDDRK